jgi:hypothetical protein
MEIHKELEDLRAFTTKVLEEKRISTSTKATDRERARVESVVTIAPMAPRTFEKPAGRGPVMRTTTDSATVGVTGAFSRVYVDDDGNTMLQGGTVQGSDSTPVVVPSFQLLASGGTAPADGTHVSISIGVTAFEDDDVIVPGCTVNTAVISEGDPGAATIPTDGSPAGSVDLSLGMWQGEQFRPAGLTGNIIVVHYLGTLLIQRA